MKRKALKVDETLCAKRELVQKINGRNRYMREVSRPHLRPHAYFSPTGKTGVKAGKYGKALETESLGYAIHLHGAQIGKVLWELLAPRDGAPQK